MTDFSGTNFICVGVPNDTYDIKEVSLSDYSME